MSVGQHLAALLPDDAVVSVEGTLGAGKSVLVRGIASGLGIDPETVTSPTFTLWQTHTASRILHHLDAYRLESASEFLDLGAEELFQSPGLVLIEWGEKVRSVLPSPHFQLEIEILDSGQRSVKFRESTSVSVDERQLAGGQESANCGDASATVETTTSSRSPGEEDDSASLRRRPLLARVADWPRWGADWLIRFYQVTISPWLPVSCRYQPTCSQYARQAIAKYGLLVGGFKAAWRILRCHPFSRSGPDPLK